METNNNRIVLCGANAYDKKYYFNEKFSKIFRKNLEEEIEDIYDEYPDQLQIRLMSNRVYDKVKDMEDVEETNLKEMIQLMLFHEIFRCRCEHRKKRRKFYL